MGEIVNPYIAGAPIAEQRMFFGREDIFRWIETSISGQYADHILVIHGQRRVGKTSVLKQLGNRLPDRYIPVFFDLQGRTHTTLDRFLWWLAREIVRVLKQERGIEVSLPEKDDFARDPEHFENRFLPDLKPVLAGRSLLLTFDEFDNLEESEVREDLARPLVDYLRRLMGREGLNFIFSIGSSGRKLENMQAAYTDFFKAALYKKISFLDEEQTRHLVTSPVEGVLTYTHEAVGRIYALASGHPYFTQLTCHELFARCQRTEQREITRDDVEAVLDDVVERGTVNLKFVWDEASDIEKWCLAALANVQKTDLRTLTDYLRKNRVRFTDSDLTSGLLHLREKDVLTPDNRFVVQLLQRWLQKNRPIEQVREELTEVNPIANRYIEIGLEYKDAGLYEKAVGSFQEALAISKDNIQAQVNIALAYMDQNLHEKAVVEFEKALSMDDEDVSARAWLCEAHLALGNAAMTKGRFKDAVLSYQRVLGINAEHTEARQRMAELSRRRAEDALKGGREDEALDAFAEALKYTPEDSTLRARMEQVSARKKARQLAALTLRSEKEAEAGNWSGAIKSLEEALDLSPEDEAILGKIGQAKAAQEKARALAAIYTDAQKAYADKDYDKAVSLFKKIVLEDENYKDASRLLSQSIELRRKAPKWWRKNPFANLEPPPLARPNLRSYRKFESTRVRGIGIVLVIVIGMGGMVWLGINRLSPMLTSGAKTETVPAGTVAPVLTSTPVIDSAVHAAFAAIQNEEPLYQSAFDSWEFGEPEGSAAVDQGKLILVAGEDQRASAVLYNLASDRMAVEFKFIQHDTDPGGHCIFEVVNEGVGSSIYRADSVEFHEDGQAVLSHHVGGGRHDELASGRYDGTKWNTVTLIILGGKIAAYMNGQPLYAAIDPDGSALFIRQSLSASHGITCEYDDFKIWNLSGVDFSAVQAALEKMHNEAPLYQTSFDSWDFGASHGIVRMENGKLLVNSEDQEHAGVIMQKLISDRYAVEFEFRILESSPVGHCIFETANNYDSEAPSWRAMNAGFLSNGKAILGYYVHPNQIKDFVESTTEFDSSSARKVALIVIGDRTAVFIDGSYAFTAVDPSGSVQYVFESLSANYTAQCEYDNFKIWDLSGLASASLIPEVRVAPKDGMLMRYVPAGSFVMGSDMGAGNEKPAHDVYLDSFWIDQTEITNKMYSLCETAGDCPAPIMHNSYSRSSYYGNDEFANYPVIYVDWDMASAYCAWADRRLPTEAEWEKAARGTTGYIYPWGGDAVCENVNAMGCKGETSPVGEYVLGKSPYGLFDMAGNVMEWVADWYDSEYYQYSPRENPLGPSTGSRHVLRGGSWKSNEFSLRSTFRSGLVPDETNLYLIGFRCAQGINP